MKKTRSKKSRDTVPLSVFKEAKKLIRVLKTVKADIRLVTQSLEMNSYDSKSAFPSLRHSVKVKRELWILSAMTALVMHGLQAKLAHHKGALYSFRNFCKEKNRKDFRNGHFLHAGFFGHSIANVAHFMIFEGCLDSNLETML
jgi:hypothetical protein